MRTKIITASILALVIASVIYLQQPISSSSNLHIFLLSQNKGILISDDGDSWDSYNSGLPDNFEPLQLHSAKTGNSHILYLTTYQSGIFRRIHPGEDKWTAINHPDFKTRSQFRSNPGFRTISAFAIDPTNPKKLVMATKHTIYISDNSGGSWQKANARGLGSRNYITAVARKNKIILAGTSFNSVYISFGGRFRRVGRGLPKEPYSGNNYFTEEINYLAFDKTGKTQYAGTAFGKGAFYSTSNGRYWKSLKVPIDKKNLKHTWRVIPHNGSIFVNNEDTVYIKNHKQKSWQSFSHASYIKEISSSVTATAALVIDQAKNYPPLFFTLPQKSKPLKGAAVNKRSLYVPVYVAKRKLPAIIRSLKKTGFNAVVIDMKDDFGNLYFPTNNKVAQKIRSTRRPVAVKKILKQLKDNGIYTIARIVVFKDKRMFFGFGYKYAIKNRRTGRPWRGNRREYWVDPHADVVQQYNIDIGKELAALGFDEIQFDYIRFPSDGPVYLCSYPHKKDKSMYKSEILADFLSKAKSQIKVPISVDIYGFNSWYHFGNWIGQDMEVFSRIVDVICPMVYPSHFGRRWYMRGKRALRPYRIVYDGGKRGVKLIQNRVPLRPYIQAFRMSSPTWGPGYIKYQAQGAIDSGCSGFIYWNARGNYRMVERAFQKK